MSIFFIINQNIQLKYIKQKYNFKKYKLLDNIKHMGIK